MLSDLFLSGSKWSQWAASAVQILMSLLRNCMYSFQWIQCKLGFIKFVVARSRLSEPWNRSSDPPTICSPCLLPDPSIDPDTGTDLINVILLTMMTMPTPSPLVTRALKKSSTIEWWRWRHKSSKYTVMSRLTTISNSLLWQFISLAPKFDPLALSLNSSNT